MTGHVPSVAAPAGSWDDAPPPFDSDAPPELDQGNGRTVEAPSRTTGEGWEPPAAFHQIRVPAFPTATFPGWLQAFVEAVAEATQTPADLPGMMSLAALATACGGRFEVEVQPDYQEPLNLFVVVAMPPASLKSAVFKAVAAPIERWERERAREMAPQITEEQTARAIKEKRLETIKARAAKEQDTDEREALTREAAELAEELRLQVVTAAPRLLADDCTPEALVSLLADHGGRMAVLSPEGGLFDLMAGRYTDGKLNLDVYLKGHAGDTIRVDRKGRGPEFVESPALTVGLAVQPSMIRELGERASFRGRGLLARFFYALPPSTVGRRRVDPNPVPVAIREAYHRTFLRLLGMELEGEGLAMLHLTPEALRAWLDFRRWLEPQLAESGTLGPMSEWAGKLHGAVARVAGLLHVAKALGLRELPTARAVDLQTMEAAMGLGEYLIGHAQAAFAEMGVDPAVEDARRVLRWIEKNGAPTFTARDCFQGTKGYFKRMKNLCPSLAILEEHGYIRRGPEEQRGGRGRKPSPRYEVNPYIWSHNSHNSQKDDSTPFCGNSENTGNHTREVEL